VQRAQLRLGEAVSAERDGHAVVAERALPADVARARDEEHRDPVAQLDQYRAEGVLEARPSGVARGWGRRRRRGRARLERAALDPLRRLDLGTEEGADREARGWRPPGDPRRRLDGIDGRC
jgi:hypothetical protein